MTELADGPVTYDDVVTQYVEMGGRTYAYRRLGPRTGTPLLLCMRYRGTIDHWDPALIDVLAAERDVIVFDNRGIGFTGGTPAMTVEGMSAGVRDVLDGLGLDEDVDILGWSLGGLVAQGAILAQPERFRHLILAGSTLNGVPGQPGYDPKGRRIDREGAGTDEEVLYLFFPDTADGRQAGLQSRDRINRRLSVSAAAVTSGALRGQSHAIDAVGDRYWSRLPELELPVLLANGARDVIVNSYATYSMTLQLKHAKAILWSDAGHGFLYQHAEEFGEEVVRFVSRA
jgi:pimeloyl-ACP methyl ester carboxylesterase